MPPNPAISVVMSVHNHQAYVRQAVESVLGQSFLDWELILLNNGSTDASPRIIDELARHDVRIRAFHQPNLGLPASRNRGIGLARAGWIAYLDSDDVWFPDTLAHFAAYIDAHPSAQFIFGHAHRLRGDEVTELPGAHQDRAAGTRELFQRMFLTPLAVCHRRELWDRAGRFDSRLVWCDDYDLFLRMSLLCRFEPLGRALGLRRRHDQNLSAPSGPSFEAEAEVLHRFAAGPGRDVLEPRLAARRLAHQYGRAARRYLRERNYSKALALAEQASSLASSWRYRMLVRFCSWLAPSQLRNSLPLQCP